VDRFDRTVADLVADAEALPFADESAAAVRAAHLIEHLGYLGALRMLGEAHRVLRPGGRLELETPDPRASFRSFLAARAVHARAERLTWVFGHEQPGGGHRILFPRELLRAMLRDAGFDRIRFERPRTHLHRDGLRVVARRDDAAAARLLPHLRAAASRILPPPAGHIEALEIERALAGACAEIARSHGLRNLERAAFDLMRIRPALVPAALAAAERVGRPIPAPLARRLASVARRAERGGFTAALHDRFDALAAAPSRAIDAFERTVGEGRAALRAAAADPRGDPARRLRGTARRRDSSTASARPFTRDGAVRAMAALRDRAIRDIDAGRPEAALDPLRRAICSGLCDLHAVWNMAVAQAQLARFAPADDYYAAALRFGGLPPAVRATLRLERATCRLHADDPEGAAAIVRGLRAPDAPAARRAAAIRRAAGALRLGRGTAIPPIRGRAVPAGEGFHVR
jgi:SAM-dependent methyltransferase